VGALPGAMLLAAQGLTRLGCVAWRGVAWTGVAPAARLRHLLIARGVGLVVGALSALRRGQPEGVLIRTWDVADVPVTDGCIGRAAEAHEPYRLLSHWPAPC
jgi:hypothetical protein